MTMRDDGSTRVSRRRLLFAIPMAALAGACKGGAPASCRDTSALGADDLNARTALGYAETSMDPKLRCTACRQYVPASSSDACGSCKIMKGPIHPNGTCRVFAAM